MHAFKECLALVFLIGFFWAWFGEPIRTKLGILTGRLRVMELDSMRAYQGVTNPLNTVDRVINMSYHDGSITTSRPDHEAHQHDRL